MSSISSILRLARTIRSGETDADSAPQGDDRFAEEEFVFPAGSIHSVSAVELLLLGESKNDTDSRIWVCAQSVTDCFFYVHVKQGRTVRALVLGETEDAQWERVEGTPEPWEEIAFESEAVFGPDDEEVSLGSNDRWPIRGDIAIAPDSMKYAHAALQYWRK